MITEILSSRFQVTSVDTTPEQYKNIRIATFTNKAQTITIDYNCKIFSLTSNAMVDILLYNTAIENEDVPLDFEYLMVGKMYEVNNDKGYVYSGSFGGLKFEMRCEEEMKELNDNCDIAIAIKKL